jgi:hypothetical protein
MWFQKVLHSQAVTWWKELAVLAVHAEARAMYIWNSWGTDYGGTISDDNSEVLSRRNGCQGEKAVTETFNGINIS